VIIYDKIKDFGKLVENGYWPVISNTERFFFFKAGTRAVCFTN
jgi:hypothetical protein